MRYNHYNFLSQWINMSLSKLCLYQSLFLSLANTLILISHSHFKSLSSWARREIFRLLAQFMSSSEYLMHPLFSLYSISVACVYVHRRHRFAFMARSQKWETRFVFASFLRSALKRSLVQLLLFGAERETENCCWAGRKGARCQRHVLAR